MGGWCSVCQILTVDGGRNLITYNNGDEKAGGVGIRCESSDERKGLRSVGERRGYLSQDTVDRGPILVI